MKGREVAEIRFKNVDLKDRADAEFFSKENLLINERLNHTQTIELGELGKIAVSAFYPAATHLYEIGEVPFIRCVDCINFPVISDSQNDSFERIPQDFLDRHSNIDTVKRNELIITKVGSPCYASIVGKDEELALSRTVMGLKDIRGINPFYLLAFLRSYYGFSQLLRQRELTIQYQLTVERVKAVKVFLPSLEFQSQIENIVKQSHKSLEESRVIYKQAENLLLEAVGLKDFEPSEEKTNVKNFKESFLASGRLDAEFYQKKYDSAYEKLQGLKPRQIVPLESLLETITNGQTPLRHDLSEGEVVFLTAEHISDFRINYDSDKRVLLKHHEEGLAKTAVETNDLLITIKGKIGNVAVVEEVPQATNINQDVGLLRLKEGINPYYIAGYINSALGRMFVQQISTGQINPFLGLGNLRTIPVPIFDNADEIGNAIRQKVTEAETAQRKSKNLLETAKRAVEIAIEENEESAIKFLNALTI